MSKVIDLRACSATTSASAGTCSPRYRPWSPRPGAEETKGGTEGLEQIGLACVHPTSNELTLASGDTKTTRGPDGRDVDVIVRHGFLRLNAVATQSVPEVIAPLRIHFAGDELEALTVNAIVARIRGARERGGAARLIPRRTRALEAIFGSIR